MAGDKRYVWFGPESVAKLRDALNAASPEARLEIHEHKHDEFTLHVVEPSDVVATDGGGGGINESHICPPQCP